MTQQLNLFEGRAARDAALQTVADNSGDFMERALDAILGYEVGREVTGEDIRFRCEQRSLRPHHPNAWGALVNTAVRRKLLIPTDKFVSMKDKSSHARMTRVYKVS